MIDQKEIHQKSRSDKVKDRIKAASQLRDSFADLPDKSLAWEDLHILSTDENSSVRSEAAFALWQAFSHVPDKNLAWNDLCRLSTDQDIMPLWIEVAYKFGLAFPQVSDKFQAWESLHKLSIDGNSSVRGRAAKAIGQAFPYIPNKNEAWADLHRLSTEDDNLVRSLAASAIGRAFPHVPDKNQAWEILHRLTTDNDNLVRGSVAQALGMAFSHVPDKKQAWLDLYGLSTEYDYHVKMEAATAIGQAFFQIPDKKEAWEVLLMLTTDNDRNLRFVAAFAISQAFSQVPDKKQAWQVLHRLTTDGDSFVRGAAASALGAVFSQIPDKNRAYKDLYRLSTDNDSDVRVSANHSLGKASIFKATESEHEKDFMSYLENALEFFERSAKEATYFDPSNFCLPFYRSFYALTFKKQDAEAEVQKYLAEAKSASEGSQSKEKLLEAIENLSNALKEAQNLGEMGLDAKKRDLNACRRYCDRAAELLAEAREDAPGATRLIEKGLPIIDHRIRETLAEIREKTKAVCKQTLDTPAEEFGKEIARQGKALCQVRDPIQLDKALSNLDGTLSSQVKDPEIQGLIERARSEPNVEDRLNIYNIILGMILGKSQGAKGELAKTINIENVNIPGDSDENSVHKHLKISLEIATLVVAVVAVLIAAFEAGIL